MKLVIISPFQFRLQRGIERFTYSLANALADLGHEVLIYSYSKKGAIWGDKKPGVTHRLSPGLKYYEGYLAIFFFRKWLRKDKPDSIILNFIYHGESWLPKNLSYVYVLNSPASQIPNRYDFIKKNVPRFKNMQFVAVSEMVKRETLPFIHSNPITVIPNGVDTSYFKPGDSYTSKAKIFLITLAAFEERKGMQYVISALAQLGKTIGVPYEYHIFGDGPYFGQLNELIKVSKMDNIIFIHSSSSDALGELQKADIFLLPSKGEAFALAPIEAMACGLPIIVSNFDPYPEFVKEAFGLMVDRENPEQLVNSIRKIIDNYESMSKASREFSLRYDWSNIAKKYLTLFLNEN